MKTRKEMLKLLLICIFLLNTIPNRVFAEESKETSNLLTPNEAFILANEYAQKVDMILDQDDSSYPMNAGQEKNSQSIIKELYDKDDNVVAYLIFTNNGYIVITVDPKNPKVLESLESMSTKADLEQKIISWSKLYYFFPFQILTEEEKDQYVKEHIDKNLEVYSDPYSSESILSESESNIEDMEQISSTANTIIQLKRVDDFVPLLIYKDGSNWGGRSWFEFRLPLGHCH